MVDNEKNWALKNAMYGGYITTMSLSMIPLINMFAMTVVLVSLIETTMIIGSLGLVAYNAPSE